jgi:hypothetical protein
VPDIYDSAKYDSIHNSHLNLSCLKVGRDGWGDEIAVVAGMEATGSQYASR